jgi:hypothetical protein
LSGLTPGHQESTAGYSNPALAGLCISIKWPGLQKNKQTRQKEVILLAEKVQVSDKITHHDWNNSASVYEQLPKHNL